MATYNGEKFIAQQIESILAQTYKNFKLIICDDNSTDDTVKIIQTFIKNNPNITLYKNKKNIGFVKNFEKLINLCNTNYIALSDQDDIWIETKLATQISKLQNIKHKNPDSPLMIHSDLTMINEKEEILNKSYFKYRKYQLIDEKDLGQILGPCGVMGNTILFNKQLKSILLPFPDNLEYHDYWIAIINEIYGNRITINQALVKYRIHDKNVSNNQTTIANTKTFTMIIKEYIQGKASIPYINSNKKEVIQYILENFSLEKDDSIVLIHFQRYLQQKNSKFLLIFYMLSNNLLKRDFIYRFKFIIKQLVRR